MIFSLPKALCCCALIASPLASQAEQYLVKDKLLELPDVFGLEYASDPRISSILRS